MKKSIEITKSMSLEEIELLSILTPLNISQVQPERIRFKPLTGSNNLIKVLDKLQKIGVVNIYHETREFNYVIYDIISTELGALIYSRLILCSYKFVTTEILKFSKDYHSSSSDFEKFIATKNIKDIVNHNFIYSSNTENSKRFVNTLSRFTKSDDLVIEKEHLETIQSLITIDE